MGNKLGVYIHPFCVPLIVIGFIAPSITKLGKSATRMLCAAVILRKSRCPYGQ